MANYKLPTVQVGDKQVKIEYVPIAFLKPAEYNARIHPEQTIEKAKNSISQNGFCDPIIVNCAVGREGVIIGGHLRVTAARELGYDTVPAVFLNIPNIEKEKALNISLNAISGEWDFEKLKNWDFGSLVASGFDPENLSAAWDGMLEVEGDDFNVEKEMKKAVETDIKLGDLFQLGTHRIICGNSQDSGTIIKLMGKEQASMLCTDPIYNLSVDYGKGIGGKGNYGGDAVNDSRSRAEYENFLSACIQNVLDVCRPDCHFFTWCDEVYTGHIQQIYGYLGIENKRICLWVKDNQNPTPKIAFNKVTEYCIYGTIGRPYLNDSIKNFNEILNKEVGTGNRLHDDILDLLNIWLVKRLPSSEYTHPTEKPASLHEKPLRRCSRPGDIVLDIFSGSGSIMVACEQLKRRAFMCDITPAFVQLTINRYELLTGQKAVKLN